MEETKLHFSRIRKRGEASWFDPQTDIRQLIPAVFLVTIEKMEDMYAGKPEEKDCLYLHNIFRIFQIRILEDKAPLDSQITEFFSAVARVSDTIRTTFMSEFVAALLCIYGLFCRRDSISDHDALITMLEYTRLTTLKDLLSDESMRTIRNELSAAGVSLLVQNRTESDASVLCHETGQYLDHVKDIAARFISCSGRRDWNAVAEACDREFSRGSAKTTEEGIALALAYPTYDQPTLTVEVENGSEDKAGATADAGEPGAVQVDSRQD